MYAMIFMKGGVAMENQEVRDEFFNEPMVAVEFITFKSFSPLSWSYIQECAEKHGEEPGEYIKKAIMMRMKKEKDWYV